MQRVLILGGYGITGKLIAQLLLQETEVEIILAGRNLIAAQQAAFQLNNKFEGERVTGTYADASLRSSLDKAFKNTDMVIMASSTSEYAKSVALAALEAGSDYFDIQYSAKKTRDLGSMAQDIKKAGRCFITDGGFHPGLPAALVHQAAHQFDRLEKANVGSVIKVDWRNLAMSQTTVREFLEMITNYESMAYRGGRWKSSPFLGMLDTISMDFGAEFGRQYCVPMFLEEMRSIPPDYPHLTETGFFVGGFNFFVDWFLLPVAAIALRIWPQRALNPLSKWMDWGLKTFSRPPYGTLLKVEASGMKDGKAKSVNIIVSHEDGYLLTAIPVLACLLQYLGSSIRQPGLWTQANVVEPARFFEDMARLGVGLQTDVGGGD